MVTREVCFSWDYWNGPEDMCRWSVNVAVVACQGFYLYNLTAPPTSCLRYCGDGLAWRQSTTTTVSPPVTTARPAFSPQCQAPAKLLSAASRSTGFVDAGVQVCDDAGNGFVLSGAAANNDWTGPGW